MIGVSSSAVRVATIAAFALVLVACNSTTPSPVTTPPTSGSPGPFELTRIELPVAPGATVEGLVEVNGHDIYARCAGDGAPTVIYFVGWSPSRGLRAVDVAPGIEEALGSDIRVCSYERRNTGRSEEVEGTQTPQDVIDDVDGLMEALGEDGPFVLLGASFGGQVAAAYSVAHPDRVVGVVNIDGSTGVDYDIDEAAGFTGACLQSNRDADAYDSQERIDNCTLAKYIFDNRDKEPDVPLIYLVAKDPADRGDVADDDVRREWVESWSPGKWQVTDAPHSMDMNNPELVAQAIREVIELANQPD
jgi:pimeloyl-ACP methyl ester carboxylesterase